MTKQEAEVKRDWYQKRYDFPFIVEEWGPFWRVLAIRTCQQCGEQFKQGGEFDKPALCENCDRKKRQGILKEATAEGEKRRAELRHYRDFEEVCQ